MLVTDKKSVLNNTVCSYEEREVQLQEKEKALNRKKNSPFKEFIQTNKKTIPNRRDMVMKNKVAYAILLTIEEHMDKYNCVACSYKVFMETLGVSKSSIANAIALLKKENFIEVYKSGTTNVYVVNSELDWQNWGTNYKYAKFNTKMIISESEQDKKTKEKIKYIK